MYSRILVPIDGSEPSRLGLQEAVKLARAMHGSIRLIHVIDALSMVTASGGVAGYQIVLDALRKGGQELLAQAQALVSREGIEVDTILFEGSSEATGACVVSCARECHADLIVCGTHGRRGLERMLMGSAAEYIVRHSPVPVLLVRQQTKPGEKQHTT